jgi:hypothetical protein
MWLMYPWPDGERPFVFHWASHVKVFIGRDPNLYHMLAFLGVHVLLIVVIYLLPLEKWFDNLKIRFHLTAAPAIPAADLPGLD